MWRILLALLVISVPSSFVLGCKYRAGQDARAAVKAGLRTLHTVQASDQATTKIAVKDQQAQDRIVYVTRTLTKEVHDAIPPAADVPLSVGFVRYHDAAALGVDLSAVPDPAGRPDEAPSEIAASTAASAIVGNYGGCRADEQRLSDLQAWVSEQAKLHQP